MNYSQARINMVDGQIHTAGVTGEDILNSFQVTPRERFVPDTLKEVAYSDDTLSLGEGCYLLEPMAHARMIQAVAPQPGDVVLDIGAATGYSSAILSRLVSTVVALENARKFIKQAELIWTDLGACNVVGLEGCLKDGAPAHAPYTLIIINGAVASVPENILSQLSPRGRLITIVKEQDNKMGRMTLVQRNDDNCFSAVELFDANAPYLSGFESENSFHF